MQKGNLYQEISEANKIPRMFYETYVILILYFV
jgi:hypothetical protein